MNRTNSVYIVDYPLHVNYEHRGDYKNTEIKKYLDPKQPVVHFTGVFKAFQNDNAPTPGSNKCFLFDRDGILKIQNRDILSQTTKDGKTTIKWSEPYYIEAMISLRQQHKGVLHDDAYKLVLIWNGKRFVIKPGTYFTFGTRDNMEFKEYKPREVPDIFKYGTTRSDITYKPVA